MVGPTAELVQSLQGNYNGPPPAPVSPLEGIERRFAGAKSRMRRGRRWWMGLRCRSRRRRCVRRAGRETG